MGKIKIGLIVLGSIALVGLVLAGIVMAKNGSNNGKAEYVSDEIIVKFKGEKEFRVLKAPQGKVREEVEKFKKRAEIEYAEPNYIAYALMVPNDPYYKYQWHLDNKVYGGIQMEEAWDVSAGAGVTVAVVDTGIRKGTDLANTCFISGWDYVNNDSDPTDDNGHGTHVAGTIAQSTNNALGVAGVAYKSCLMPVKVLGATGSGTYANVALGIRYAADNGAKVINLSLGGSDDSQTLKDAVAYAYQKGVTVIAAAGNDGKNILIYPAAYDAYVIAVGATQYDETKAPYSNYGPSLDLVAPGGNTTLDQNKDGYGDGVLQQTFTKTGTRISWGYYFFQGTSMAAPHVAGVAALLIAIGNATTTDEIRTALQETAEDKGAPGRDDTYGWGLVNAFVALKWTAQPACLTDGDCNDNVSCTVDSCVSGKCVYTPNDTNCSTDDWFETGKTQWVSIGQCTEKEQKEQEYRDYYCDPVLDCQYNVTNTQWIDTGVERNKSDGTACEDGQFCSTGDTCQSGICTSGPTRSCDDSNSCTADSCDVANDKCLNAPITTCSGLTKDGCCPTGCTSGTDVDCPTSVLCWSGSNQYLYRAADQSRKFCKCAQGTYGYNSYKYSWGTKTVWRYVDPANNEYWQVTSSSSYTPVYSVTCTDSRAYLTNQNYYYPK